MNAILYAFAGVTNTALNVTLIVLFLVFSVALMLVTVFLLTRFIYRPRQAELNDEAPSLLENEQKKKKEINFLGLLFSFLGLGLIIRLIFVFAIKGDRTNFNLITDLFGTVSSSGITTYYSNDKLAQYPLFVYLYSFIGIFVNAFSLTSTSAFMQFFIKLPLVFCDVALAGVLYSVAKKYSNEYVGLILAGFVSLFPAFIFASAIWGSFFSLVSLLFVLVFYFMSTKNFLALIGVFSLALLSCKEALYLYPIVAVFIVYSYVKICTNFQKSPPANGLFSDKEAIKIVLIPSYIVFALILMYLICLPLLYNITANFFKFISIIFFKPLINLRYFGYNGLNIFNLFLRNGVELSANFPFAVFAVLFSVIVTALVLIVYLSKKNRANLSFLAVYIIMIMSIFYMDFTAMSTFSILGLLLLSFILIKDKRLLHVLTAVGFAAQLNAFATMAVAGHLSNLSDYDLSSSSNAFYTGYSLLIKGGALAVSIISTLIMLVAFIYSTIIILDLSMSNKRKLFKNLPESGFFESIKSWIK